MGAVIFWRTHQFSRRIRTVVALITIFDGIFTRGAIDSSVNIADPESKGFLLNCAAREPFTAVLSTNVTKRTAHDDWCQRAKVVTFSLVPMLVNYCRDVIVLVPVRIMISESKSTDRILDIWFISGRQKIKNNDDTVRTVMYRTSTRLVTELFFWHYRTVIRTMYRYRTNWIWKIMYRTLRYSTIVPSITHRYKIRTSCWFFYRTVWYGTVQ